MRSGPLYECQILPARDHCKNRTKSPETDQDRLVSVRSFLQDYYGQDVSINQYLKFDLLLQPVCGMSESILELELAKIAVVLIGIGILDTNRELFIGPALQLPPQMHFNIMTIIQSVVQAGSSSEVALTDNIEQVLLEPSGNQSLPPILNLQRTQFNETCQTFTPKDARPYSSLVASSILHKGRPPRNFTSPNTEIIFSSPSSPLAQFVQSPQFIQKAVLAQKELEIRKLKQKLSDQNFFNDELQLNFQDKTSECAAKEAEILRLQEKIRELQHLKEEITELRDVKTTCSDLQDEIYRVNQKMLRFEQYKEKCQILEKEASDHYQEVEQLHKEIKTLEAEVRKYKESADTIRQLDRQVSYQRQQLEEMTRCKQEWENDRKALINNQDMLKDTISKLQDELNCLQAPRDDNNGGESMAGIFLDIQMGELRCQIEELKQQEDCLHQQLTVAQECTPQKEEELQSLTAELSEKADLIAQLEAGSAANEVSLRQAVMEVDGLKNLVSSQEEELQELKVSLSEKKQEELEVQNLSESLRDKTAQLNTLRINNYQIEVGMNLVTRQLQEKMQECSELTKKICNQSEQIACLIRQSGEKEAECLELTKTVSILTEKVNSLRSHVEVMVCGCSVHTERMAELTKQVEHWNCQYSAIAEECSESSRVQLELVSEIRNFKNQYEAKVIECSELKDRLSSLSEVINGLNSDYAAKSEECAETKARLMQMTDQFKLVSEQMQIKMIECSEHSRKLEEITEKLKELEGELQYKLHEINTMSQENIQMMENLKVKDDICSELLEEKNELVSDLRERDKMLISLRNELTDKNEIVISLLEMKDNVLKQVRTKEKEVEKLAVEVEELKEEICQSRVKQEICEKICHEKTKSCAMLEEDISKYVSKLHVTQSETENLQLKVQALMDEMTAMTYQKNEQIQKLNDLQKAMEDKMEVLNNQIQAKTVECAGYGESISELTGKVLDYEEKLKAGNEKLVALSEVNDQLQDVIGEKEVELMSLQTKLTCQAEMVSKYATERETIQERIEQMQADNENLIERNACQQKELVRFEEQLEKKSNFMVELSEMLEQKSIEFTELLSEKSNLCTMNCDLETACEELRAEVAKYKSLCSDLESTLQILKDELNHERLKQLSLLEELTRAKEMVQREADVCNELREEVSEKSATVSKLQAEKDQMQGEIKSLKLSWKEAAEVVQEKDNKLQVLEAEQYWRTKMVSMLKEQMAAQAATIKQLTQAVNGRDSDIQLKTRLLDEQAGSLKASKVHVSAMIRKFESTGAVKALQGKLEKKEQHILHLVEAKSKRKTLEKSRETEKQEQKMRISKFEARIQCLQEENTTIMERETRFNDFDAQMRTANDFCSSLQKQLDGANSNLELAQKKVKLPHDQNQKEQQIPKTVKKNTALVNTLKQEHDNTLKLQKRIESYTGKYEEVWAKFESMQKENKSLDTATTT